MLHGQPCISQCLQPPALSRFNTTVKRKAWEERLEFRRITPAEE